MKKLLISAGLSIGLAIVALGAGPNPTPPSSAFGRELMKVPDAAAARVKLGVTDASTTSNNWVGSFAGTIAGATNLNVPGLAGGATVFLSTNGNNATATLNDPTRPFLTLGAAISNCPAGGTVWVAPNQKFTFVATNYITQSLNVVGNGSLFYTPLGATGLIWFVSGNVSMRDVNFRTDEMGAVFQFPTGGVGTGFYANQIVFDHSSFYTVWDLFRNGAVSNGFSISFNSCAISNSGDNFAAITHYGTNETPAWPFPTYTFNDCWFYGLTNAASGNYPANAFNGTSLSVARHVVARNCAAVYTNTPASTGYGITGPVAAGSGVATLDLYNSTITGTAGNAFIKSQRYCTVRVFGNPCRPSDTVVTGTGAELLWNPSAPYVGTFYGRTNESFPTAPASAGGWALYSDGTNLWLVTSAGTAAWTQTNLLGSVGQNGPWTLYGDGNRTNAIYFDKNGMIVSNASGTITATSGNLNASGSIYAGSYLNLPGNTSSNAGNAVFVSGLLGTLDTFVGPGSITKHALAFHGLSGVPYFVRAVAVCTANDDPVGVVTGQETDLACLKNNFYFSIWANSTRVGVNWATSDASPPSLLSFTNDVYELASIDPTKYQVKLYAYGQLAADVAGCQHFSSYTYDLAQFLGPSGVIFLSSPSIGTAVVSNSVVATATLGGISVCGMTNAQSLAVSVIGPNPVTIAHLSGIVGDFPGRFYVVGATNITAAPPWNRTAILTATNTWLITGP